jgi:hypothetical protein
MKKNFDKVYVLEIGGLPILAYEADSFNNARGLIKEQWLLSDLKEARSNRVALWDGKSPLTVRNSSVQESEIFAAGKVEAKETDDMLIVYLIERDA